MAEQKSAFHGKALTTAHKAARGLAWFSFGLGAVELLFSGPIARALGFREASAVRSYGMREIAAGLAALQPNPAPAIWGRLSSDALDFWTLFSCPRTATPQQRRNVSNAMAMVAIIGIVDLVVAAALTSQTPPRAVGRQRARASRDHEPSSALLH